MAAPGVVLAVAVVAEVLGAVLALAWGGQAPRWGTVETVVYPTGTHLSFAPAEARAYTVRTNGGRLLGAATVDHSLALAPWASGAAVSCPARVGSSPYSGAPRTFAIDESLASGPYFCGDPCGGAANVTVSSPIELVVS